MKRWDWTDWLFAVFIAVTSVLILGGLIAPIVAASGPTFTLRKADWHCTAHHAESWVSFTTVGKTQVPITHVDNVCDTYVRVGR